VNPPDAVALLGPTASGKSALSMQLAQRFDLEIISVDSALVYRGMDIGTAKPSPTEQARVAHHLIDLIDPTQAYSAARFAADARGLIDEIRARGRLPLLVGGTMLYIKALRSGLDELPQADAQVRARIDAQAALQGWPAMHAELARIDPVTAARLAPGDSQRIQRALEVHALTGRTLSSLHSGGERASLLATEPLPIGRVDGAHQTASRPPPTIALIALEPSDRSVLHQRIAQRFQSMLDAGLLDEVRALRARGDLHTELPSMRCVGYRQAWAYLDELELERSAGAGSVQSRRQHFIDAGVAATRQLAKRQLTWLRGMPDRQVVDCLAPDAAEQVSAIIASLGAPLRRP